jgi:glycosyltransferase involved in cell wall biosynthesis
MALPERARRSALDNLTFHGPVSQPELFEAFRRADILAFPTLSDGFGMVVTEALAHGLPVLTTPEAGASDLITPGHNGLIVPSGDPNALKDAFQWCLDNRPRLRAMKLEALKTAQGAQWSDFRRRVRAVTAGADTVSGKDAVTLH